MKKKPHNHNTRLFLPALLCLVFIFGFTSKGAFAVDYLVQSGETTLSSTEDLIDVPLGTTVDFAHSFYLLHSTSNQNANSGPKKFLVNGQLLSDGTALRLRRNADGEIANVSYSVIQHPDINVQEDTEILNAGVASINITLSPAVDVSKSVVILHRRSGAGINDHSDSQITGYLTSSTNLFVQRDTTVTDSRFRWQVVTFTDATTIQTGEDLFPNTVTLAGKTLPTPIDPTRSWLYFTVRCNGSGMSYSQVRGRIQDANTLQFERYVANSGVNPTVRWYVVEFPSGQGAAVQHGLLNTAATTDVVLNGTLTSSIDKTQTFLYHTSRGNGNGNAYSRPYWMNRFTTCTGDDCSGVQFQRWYSGQHGGIAWQAVTMPSCSSPGTPSGPNPSDDATGVSVDADLDWNDSPNATAYDVYFDTVDPPVTKVASDTPSSNHTLPTLLYDTHYFWKVVAKNACGEVEGPVWDFTTCPPTPGTPSNPSPVDDATSVSIDADLGWSVTADATAGNGFTLAPLNCGTDYYWKVVAKNICGSTSGPVWHFSTESVPTPGTAANPTPLNGATDVLLDTDLDWDDCSDAESYDVYFGDTYPPPLDGNTATSDYALPTLDSNTLYYWKITAKNKCDTTDGPDWSFTTCTGPGTPGNPSPGDGATAVSVDADLDWDDSPNATAYDVYFDTVDPPVTKVGSDIPGSSYTLPTLSFSTQYFWKIVAKNACGNAEGAVWDFTTCPPAPVAPANPSPGDGTTDISVDADLNWDDSADATSYDVYFDTVDPPVTKVASDIANSDLTLDRLNCDTHYYWKVVAKNVCNNTDGPVW
ncbi:MAG: hypothetical protein JRI70_03080, partial [Deltaproteobacteria bacterium]|nr:hypothetical protein [Deltaproteobacteria bacterium]